MGKAAAAACRGSADMRLTACGGGRRGGSGQPGSGAPPRDGERPGGEGDLAGAVTRLQHARDQFTQIVPQRMGRHRLARDEPVRLVLVADEVDVVSFCFPLLRWHVAHSARRVDGVTMQAPCTTEGKFHIPYEYRSANRGKCLNRALTVFRNPPATTQIYICYLY